MSDRFEDAPEDDSTPALSHVTAFSVPNGRDTTLPHPDLSSFTRDKRDGVGYIDDEEHSEVDAQAGELARALVMTDGGAEVEIPHGGLEAVEAGTDETAEPGGELGGEEGLSEAESAEYYDSEGDIVYGVEDEDWEVADADFTKQFNRMRQQRAILAPGPNEPKDLRGKPGTSLLPARNTHHRGRVAEAVAAKGEQPRAGLASRPKGASEVDEAGTSREEQGSRRQQLHTSVVHGLTAPFDGVASAPKSAYQYANQQGKEDRATVEGVLDPRTRNVLASMIRRGIVSAIEGCVSTGKEANVYLGIAPLVRPTTTSPSIIFPDPYPSSLAMKIYKTSILSFKTRSQYIEGEHRFKNSYSKVSNPRKMVRVWAEKELRNLRRLDEGGVRCPKVVEVRENVLVMEFLGDRTGKASPRLKDAEIPSSDLSELYGEILVTMRRIFHRCRLVHGDFSEYNILYHDSHLYIIDVSQSVEHDHPSAYDFLRADIRNIDEYFRKRSGGEVRTLGIKGTFDFVVSEKLRVWEQIVSVGGQAGENQVEVDTSGRDNEEEEEALKDVVRNWLLRGVGLHTRGDIVEDTSAATSGSFRSTQEDTVSGMAQTSSPNSGTLAADEVFMSSYIPRNMAEVVDPERDIDLMAAGNTNDLIYAGIMGMGNKEAAGPKADITPDPKPERRVAFADDAEYSSSGDSEDYEEEDGAERRPRGFRHEDRDAKKQRKKALKEENREKRKGKMPKAEKQKKIKASGGK